MGIVYCARNKVTGQRYIGQAKNSLAGKKDGHLCAARKLDSTRRPSLLSLAIRKHGAESFEWTVLFDDVDEEDLDQLEIDTIAVYQSQAPNGYNQMTGGKKGSKHSDEVRKIISEASKNISEETTKKRKESHRRRKPISEETRRKMREAWVRRRKR